MTHPQTERSQELFGIVVSGVARLLGFGVITGMFCGCSSQVASQSPAVEDSFHFTLATGSQEGCQAVMTLLAEREISSIVFSSISAALVIRSEDLAAAMAIVMESKVELDKFALEIMTPAEWNRRKNLDRSDSR